jgi:predicted negative regulator of RcsB-dependent stress response
MSLEDLDEHEQGERVRQWLRQNGGSIVLGIGAGIAALFGYNYWQGMQKERVSDAQAAFQVLLDAEQKQDADGAQAAAVKVRGEFPGTPYAAFAAFFEARDALKKSDLAAAEAALATATAKSSGLQALDQLATLRLAQVRLAKGEAQAALDLVGTVDSEGYKALAGELRGDALVALGKRDEARAAYEEALATLDAGSPQRTFVEMKRDDLTVASAPVPAAAPATPATAPAAAPATPATENKASS